MPSTIMSSSVRLLGLIALITATACERTPEIKPSPPAPVTATPARALPVASTIPATGATTSAAAVAAPSSYVLPGSARVVAIGDLHGDLNALRNALRLAGAIDSDDRWVGGKDLTVVQTGDQLDRGDHDREVLDVIEKLEGEATAAGSRFVVLNGNHELMNAGFDFRYVTRKSFASFDDYRAQASAFAGRLPAEELGRAAALAPGAPYALKLAKHLTVVRVGDNLFVHGGLLPAHVDYGLDRLNAEASAFLSGKLRALPAALGGEEAPVWTRVYGGDVDEAACQALGRTLKLVGAKRLIVGHTVQKSGINAACQERVFRIDVGLSAYYGDNPVQVLELTGQGARVLTAGGSAAGAAAGKKSQSAGPALHSAP